jgi:hypothetical protein
MPKSALIDHCEYPSYLTGFSPSVRQLLDKCDKMSFKYEQERFGTRKAQENSKQYLETQQRFANTMPISESNVNSTPENTTGFSLVMLQRH